MKKKTALLIVMMVITAILMVACQPEVIVEEKEVIVTQEVEVKVEVEVPGGARGTSGTVTVLYWQAASTLNPFLSGGTKDIYAASLVVEPMARYDESGRMVLFLAEEIPTVENGGVAEDLTSITWKLKEGLLWSDGTPVTSADAVFTAEDRKSVV